MVSGIVSAEADAGAGRCLIYSETNETQRLLVRKPYAVHDLIICYNQSCVIRATW